MGENSHRAVTRRLMRLGRILRIFLEREAVSTSWIGQDLGVNARTIQRDLLALKCAGIPVNEEKKGLYRLDKNLLKDLEVFDDAELALIVALKDMVSQLGKPFERAADDLLGRICDYTACRPVFIKMKSDIPLSGKTMSRIVKAIQGERQISFFYQGRSCHDVTAEPYRIAYFDGVWYLVARDTNDRIIKKYILDNMSDIRVLRAASKTVPKDLDEALEKSVNIWFSGERTMEVLIEVDPAWAHYFQRRWILPLQEVTELKDDGSILVRFFACSVEEVMMCLKPWLPHVRVLKPAEVAQQVMGDFKTWLAWQGTVS